MFVKTIIDVPCPRRCAKARRIRLFKTHDPVYTRDFTRGDSLGGTPHYIWRIKMAGEIPDFHAEVRTGTGKGAARQARRDGMVPGIVFGGDTDPLPINVKFNVLLKALKQGRFKSTLLNLKVEGHDYVRVICRDVQRHVVKDLPTHVDFMRLRRTTKINLFIPVEFIGEEVSPGIKRGGVLSAVRPEVELVVTAGDIPEKLVVDISTLDVGDTVTISAITLPEGAKPTIDRDFVIANISAPSGLKSSENEESDDAEAATEEA
jgi:large subunit ribosomal protein L25